MKCPAWNALLYSLFDMPWIQVTMLIVGCASINRELTIYMTDGFCNGRASRPSGFTVQRSLKDWNSTPRIVTRWHGCLSDLAITRDWGPGPLHVEECGGIRQMTNKTHAHIKEIRIHLSHLQFAGVIGSLLLLKTIMLTFSNYYCRYSVISFSTYLTTLCSI